MKNSIKKLVLFVAIMIVAACTPAQAQVHAPHQHLQVILETSYVGQVQLPAGTYPIQINMYSNRTDVLITKNNVVTNFSGVYLQTVSRYCFDLNQNGVAEPHEDMNGDGVISQADCPNQKLLIVTSFKVQFQDGSNDILMDVTIQAQGRAEGYVQINTYNGASAQFTEGVISLMDSSKLRRW